MEDIQKSLCLLNDGTFYLKAKVGATLFLVKYFLFGMTQWKGKEKKKENVNFSKRGEGQPQSNIFKLCKR